MVKIETFDDYMLARDYISLQEHFAHSFKLYISEGPEFRRRMKDDVKLRKTYRILKKNVFNGQEYGDMADGEIYKELRKLTKGTKNKRAEQVLEELINKAEAYKNN